MPNTRNLRHLNLCFSNSTSKHDQSPPISPIISNSSNHHHHHHQIHHNHPCPSSSSQSSSNMIKNFNSLYDHSLCLSSLSTITTTTSFGLEPEAKPEPEPADFAAAFSSQRFFFSSPGPSNSLVEYTNTNTSSLSFVTTRHDLDNNDNNNNNNNEKNKKMMKRKKKAVFNGSVAVPTYSPDPYLDFRRSMQEMVEARPELMDVRSNWHVLHELLLCYLALNPKSTHKFILGAFADLLVSLMPF